MCKMAVLGRGSMKDRQKVWIKNIFVVITEFIVSSSMYEVFFNIKNIKQWNILVKKKLFWLKYSLKLMQLSHMINKK